MRPSLGPRAAARPEAPDTISMRLVLKFVACGSCWPLGQPEYRTGVSRGERLRKMVYGCGAVLGEGPTASQTLLLSLFAETSRTLRPSKGEGVTAKVTRRSQRIRWELVALIRIVIQAKDLSTLRRLHRSFASLKMTVHVYVTNLWDTALVG